MRGARARGLLVGGFVGLWAIGTTASAVVAGPDEPCTATTFHFPDVERAYVAAQGDDDQRAPTGALTPTSTRGPP